MKVNNMKSIMMVLIGVSISFSTGVINNKYTFNGDFTYMEILTALANDSKRSILGNSIILMTKRPFYIIEKDFSTCISHLSKNLSTEGFSIFADTGMIFVKQINNDTSKEQKEYKVFSKYTKMWTVTTDHEKALNTIAIDSIFYYQQLEKEKPAKMYQVIFDIIGYNKSGSKDYSFSFDKSMRIDIPLLPFDKPRFSTGFNILAEKKDGMLNFTKKIILYVTDTASIFHFGSEIRRSSAKIQTDRILTESYESVFDGLTLTIQAPYFYRLTYRVDDVTIDLNGVPDSLVQGSATFKYQSSGKNLLIIPARSNSTTDFIVSAIMKINEMK